MKSSLGLDNERREHQGPDHPRSVSLVSPARPSFFGRESRASSIDDERDRNGRATKSISSSRLSQIIANDTDDDSHVKKKGFKGLLMKMKPKAKSASRAELRRPASPANEDSSDAGTPLAPPPPLSVLVGRGDRHASRERSGSMSSVQTDVSASIVGGAKRYSGSLPPGLRTAPAPQAAPASDGRQSISPTTSRFATSGPRRESYASAPGRARRRSATINEQLDDEDQLGSGMEMLSTRRYRASPEPSSLFEEPGVMPRGSAAAVPAHVASHVATYPPVTSRPHNKTTSSLSASTFIETPPPVAFTTPYFDQRNKISEVIKSPSNDLSLNRFKNLPPLPPPDQADGPYLTSPDSFAAAFPEQPDFSGPGPRYDRSPAQNGRHLNTFSQNVNTLRQADEKYPYQQPRSSFETAGDRSTRRPTQVSPRMAQSMYVQPIVSDSTGSFGRLGTVSGKKHGGGMADYSDEKTVRHKKGFKGLFGKAGKVM